MRTQRCIRWMQLLALGWFLTQSLGCGAKCQQPPSQPYTTITATDWRLVTTNNPQPQYKNISNTSTIILTFRANFQGEVDSLQDNNRQPALGLTYSVQNSNSSSGQVKVSYFPLSDPSQGNGSTTYNYTLNTELDLVETGTGYTYRFVPFQGIVLPDQVCSF